ncbi:uncharacterized protein LOC126056147 [Helicoverpa armigera]|uniref:uncharacterized protein LOC126056147 n=1 Tax=Helicoverpa armigera TaxID=29058 RepID=UPI003082CE20
MTFRNAFAIFILTYAFAEVSSWTIDLPEVRKFLFEKHEHSKKYHGHEKVDYSPQDRKFYSNIEGNSKHHEEDRKHHHHHNDHSYENEYGHHSYMEKKVYDIVRDGSSYLEGLQKSLEDYSSQLKGCQENNNTNWESSNPPISIPSSSNSSSSPNNGSMPMLNFNNYDNSPVPSRPRYPSESRGYILNSRRKMSCEEVTDSSEHIRRFASLALDATRRLQDFAYAKKYQKTDEQEENELILKLAWFLDRLAYLSGFEPEIEHSEPNSTRSPTTEIPSPQTLVPSSEELNKQFRDCIQMNSSEPATERCRYPLEIPEMVQQMLNISGTTSSPSSPSGSMTPDSVSAQSSEILITSANTSPSESSPQKSTRTKRSTDYTYYFPTKPLHEVTYPVPLVKLIKHRLSNIKSVVKTIVEKRLQHLAEKKEEKHHYEKHFDKRSISDSDSQLSNHIQMSINPKTAVKSVEKRPFESETIIHYPISDVSVINTKSFKKRSIDDSKTTSNHINRLSHSKSLIKKSPITRKKFENLRLFTKMAKDLKNTDPKIRSLKRRYTEDPLSKLANYYIKYKVWDNSNPIKKSFSKKPLAFDVKNQINEPKSVQKRSLFNKKSVHIHIPKPIQVVRTYINTRRPHHEKSKLLSHLHKIHELKHKKAEKVHKIIKRSVHYQRMYLPRVSKDPQGDISYYVKNKAGTNINPDSVQAAQMRAGLELAFQTGNIEVVRRYGANYNPLNPNPLYVGIIGSYADS